MRELTVPFGLDEQERLVRPVDAVKGKKYYCPSCMGVLIFRKGLKKVAHFAHGFSTFCTQETLLHKTAKRLICQVISNWKNSLGSVPVIERKCPGCGQVIIQNLPDRVGDAREEIALGEYRTDVALFSQGTPVAAIEIWVTHAVDDRKSKKLPIPWMELSGEDIINDPTTWRPLTDNFRPFKCKNCAEQERHRLERQKQRLVKIARISKATGVPVPKDYYSARPVDCWKCGKEILVFDWPGHEMFSVDPPQAVPIPRTIKFRYSKTVGQKYWANTCPYCSIIQGDFFVFMEPDESLMH